jgi:cell division protein ZapE
LVRDNPQAKRAMTRIAERYAQLIADGELRADPEQAEAARRLDQLQQSLEDVPKRGSLLWRLASKKPDPPRGIYLWGGVGRGKSMLMDLFHDSLDIGRKRRVHFHEFMIEVHDRLRKWRATETADPVRRVANDLAIDVRCLAFDEMVVNNSADAMIMSRLFTALIDEGVVVVTTSNRAPKDLYKDGLNREHFLPFIALIEARLDILPLNGPTDYRMERLSGVKTWHVPNGAISTAAVREAFFKMTDYPPEDSAHVPTADLDLGGGRTLHVPKSLKGVAVFSFKRLCAEARGASDYLAIARTYHTVFIVGIPELSPEKRNEAARFVTLIDALYEHKVKVIATADAGPASLYEAGDGRFEFGRTVSRLMEMQSLDYLAEGHGLK